MTHGGAQLPMSMQIARDNVKWQIETFIVSRIRDRALCALMCDDVTGQVLDGPIKAEFVGFKEEVIGPKVRYTARFKCERQFFYKHRGAARTYHTVFVLATARFGEPLVCIGPYVQTMNHLDSFGSDDTWLEWWSQGPEVEDITRYANLTVEVDWDGWNDAIEDYSSN